MLLESKDGILSRWWHNVFFAARTDHTGLVVRDLSWLCSDIPMKLMPKPCSLFCSCNLEAREAGPWELAKWPFHWRWRAGDLRSVVVRMSSFWTTYIQEVAKEWKYRMWTFYLYLVCKRQTLQTFFKRKDQTRPCTWNKPTNQKSTYKTVCHWCVCCPNKLANQASGI